MKTIIFGVLMLISGISFGQNLINTTSCRIYVRGTMSICGGPFGPVCLNAGQAIPIIGVESLVIHYGTCGPGAGCGSGLSVGIVGNCNSYPQSIPPTNTGSCCASSSTMAVSHNFSNGDFTVY